MPTGHIIAEIAALVGEPARATMLSALLDGRALTARELAFVARVRPQTASTRRLSIRFSLAVSECNLHRGPTSALIHRQPGRSAATLPIDHPTAEEKAAVCEKGRRVPSGLQGLLARSAGAGRILHRSRARSIGRCTRPLTDTVVAG